uniref:Uncharacterized protein n=1 Tax=Arundo donax TaxID=35708 RepID=A0A0A9FAV7_ARUDO
MKERKYMGTSYFTFLPAILQQFQHLYCILICAATRKSIKATPSVRKYKISCFT